MTGELRTSEQKAYPHRHSWEIAWSYKSGPGRLKEHLRCRHCKAFKGRYAKAKP